jgi:alkane 1-monooxygenase
MGVSCATLGINVAHELGHRHKAHEKVMAKLLLLTSLYMHFIIEHNRGHHRRVSTPEDPSSARKGEILYAFWFRSVTQAYLSAWKLERGMLQKKGKPFISLHNEMIRFTIFQIAFVIGILLLFGPVATLGFIAAAVMGFLLLETVNYIEHYGLSRKELSPGRYEKTRPVHSWNSDHALGRLMLFELTRHSDHHAYSGRKYQTLRHYDESPQMPAGYPAMVVLSTIPPIWFKVMHRHMEKSGLS